MFQLLDFFFDSGYNDKCRFFGIKLCPKEEEKWLKTALTIAQAVPKTVLHATKQA